MRLKETQQKLIREALQQTQPEQQRKSMQSITAWKNATQDALIKPLLEETKQAENRLPPSNGGNITALLDAMINQQLLAEDMPVHKAQESVLTAWISAAEQLENTAEQLKKALILLALFRHIPQKELAEALGKPAPTLAKWSKQAEANFTPPPAPNFD
jgi:hypothetical protein